MPKQIRFDEKDKVILSILYEDARLKNRQIALKTNLSQATVARRINKMKKLEIIKRVVPILDYKKIGKASTCFMLLDLKNCDANSLMKYLENSEEVICLYLLEGGKMLLKTVFENRTALNNFVDKIKKFFGSNIDSLYEVRSIIIEEKCPFQGVSELRAETHYEDQSKITLSNNRIRLTVDLGKGGIIDEIVPINISSINLAFSELGLLFDTFLETQFWLDELQITKPYYDIKRDENWMELNFRKSVKAISTLKDLEITKTIRLEKNLNEAKIKYLLVNNGKTAKTLTLWVCNYLDASLFSELIIPLTDDVKRIRVVNDSSRGFFTISEKEVNELVGKYWRDEWGLFVHPEKPVNRAGYFSNPLKILLMFHFNPRQVWVVKRFWGEKYVSLELLFNPASIQPGKAAQYEFNIRLLSSKKDYSDEFRGNLFHFSSDI
ncbi:MAG: Lrp/AsnC family transcriptional regulator [Candidatus Jordarchaeales archaeon]